MGVPPHPPTTGRSCTRLRGLALALWLLLVAPAAHATLIAGWDFDAGNANDTSGTPPAYDLATTGTGITFAGGAAVFAGNEAQPSFLSVAGPGGAANYTIELVVRSDGAINQGTFQGIFSNNISAAAANSWQVESHNGVYQWRNQAGTFAIGAPSGLGQWDHIVIRKFGGNDGDIWLNGVQVVASVGSNPGGLQNFRLGTNRNTSAFFTGALDGVGVHDSVEDPTALYAASGIPEPGTLALLAFGVAGLARRFRR
jgi:hypothetical protein